MTMDFSAALCFTSSFLVSVFILNSGAQEVAVENSFLDTDPELVRFAVNWVYVILTTHAAVSLLFVNWDSTSATTFRNALFTVFAFPAIATLLLFHWTGNLQYDLEDMAAISDTKFLGAALANHRVVLLSVIMFYELFTLPPLAKPSAWHIILSTLSTMVVLSVGLHEPMNRVVVGVVAQTIVTVIFDKFARWLSALRFVGNFTTETEQGPKRIQTDLPRVEVVEATGSAFVASSDMTQQSSTVMSDGEEEEEDDEDEITVREQSSLAPAEVSAVMSDDDEPMEPESLNASTTSAFNDTRASSISVLSDDSFLDKIPANLRLENPGPKAVMTPVKQRLRARRPLNRK
eukprot:m.361932 g.361932  ORF g.361932 m.361932 type:complete len:347 (+) comp19992_c0_seq1:116-1156(+)